ncbi:MAG: hypothetical protein K8J31_30080, partial [Anaerolineae bacterium]|nr:hypothetical protein [Anaerolineae bacterium]
VLPDHPRLYRLLQVRPSGSDALTAADLRSPEAYRSALQRALIARRPGRYSRRWLAARLGISVWTCRRYDRRSRLVVQPMYTERQVFWMNLDHLPLADVRPVSDGSFLETADGRRYPPVRGLAAHLLARQQPVIWKRQGWNYYGIDTYYYEGTFSAACESQRSEQSISDRIHKRDEACAQGPSAPSAWIGQKASIDPPAPHAVFWLCPECRSFHIQPERPGTCKTCQHEDWQAIPESTWRDPERCKMWWKSIQPQRTRLPRKQDAPAAWLNVNQRALAERLCQRIHQLTPTRALTHGVAYQLVRDYGAEAVKRVLRLLDERDSIANAAGFVIAVLRGTPSGSAARREARPPAEDHADWLTRLRQSPYAGFYANADQILAGE